MLRKKIKIVFGIIFVVCLIACMFSEMLMPKNKTENRYDHPENIGTPGMRITLLGGVNVEENGNRNANGYLIRTRNNKLIVVDGGETGDADLLLSYIVKYGAGTVNYWYITHPHIDHIGAMCDLIGRENCDIEIQNCYYYMNPLEWYEEYDDRGYPAEKLMYESLESSKIVNRVECQKGQIINMDNIKCEIIRIANPEITKSDNGNESSMVFKMTATDVDKSMLFLGDAYTYSSKELLEEPELLKSYAVQMAHHGQNGVTKEVYDAINPSLCFFNAPKWLYDNDNGGGYNSGKWQSIKVREWVDSYGADSILAYEGDRVVWLNENGYEILEENSEENN